VAIAYKSQGSGVATESSGAALEPLCPATVDAGDILVAHVFWEGTTTTPSTPSGWDLLSGPHVIETTIARHWVFGRIADGSEDGAAVAFGSPAVTTQRGARIYSFSGRVAGTIAQLVRGFLHTSNANDPTAPDVTTTRTDSLAVLLVGQNDNNTQASFTGETGGDYTEAVAEFTASLTPGLALGIQTATVTSAPGTITGGTDNTLNDPVGVIGFEIRVSVQVASSITIAATSSVTATVGKISAPTGITASIAATSTTTAMVAARRPIAATSAATSSVTAVLGARRPVGAAIAATSTVATFADRAQVLGRTFTAASATHGWNGGSPAALDDLLSSQHTMVLAVLRRTADASQLGVAGKSTAFASNGWQFQLDNGISPNATYGHPRLIIGTDGTLLAVSGGTVDTSADACALNAWEVAGFTYDGTAAIANANVKMYRGALDTPITEVSGYDAATTPSGTIGSDASADVTGFTRDGGLTPSAFGGQGGFLLVYKRNAAFSDTDRWHAQLGVLTYLDALRRGGSTARAVDLWNLVTGAQLLLHIGADGTPTDHANANNGTLTSASVGVAPPMVFAPTADDFHDDLGVGESTAEQDDYYHTSDFARVELDTPATAGRAWMRATMDPTGQLAPVAKLGIDVDGVFSQALEPTATGVQTVAFSGLSSATKRLAIINSPRGSNSINDDFRGALEGVFLQAVVLDAGALVVAPTVPSAALVVCGHSTPVGGFYADPPQEKAPYQQLRRDPPAWSDAVVQWAAGGLAFYNACHDATARTNSIALLTKWNPRKIIIELGANDKGRDAWSTATAESNIVAWLNGLLAAFDGVIELHDIYTGAASFESPANTNAFGEDNQDWRDFTATLPALTNPARVTFETLDSAVTVPDNLFPSDEIHVNNDGADELFAYLAPLQASVLRPFDASIAAQSAVTATLGTASPAAGITATIAATSAVSATLLARRPVSAAIAASAAVTSVLAARRSITSTIPATVSVSASVHARRAIATTIAAQSTTTTTLAARRPVVALVASSATVTGTLGARRAIAAGSVVQSSVTATVGKISAGGGLTVTIASSSAVTVTLATRRPVTASIAANGVVTASLNARRAIVADVAVTSVFTGALTGRFTITAMIAVQSGVTAVVEGVFVRVASTGLYAKQHDAAYRALLAADGFEQVAAKAYLKLLRS
jgi:hypothetical protein